MLAFVERAFQTARACCEHAYNRFSVGAEDIEGAMDEANRAATLLE